MTLSEFLQEDTSNPNNIDYESTYEMAREIIKKLLLQDFEHARKPGLVTRISTNKLIAFSKRHKLKYFGWVQQAYDELKTPRNDQTIQNQINKLKTRLHTRSKAGRLIGGSAGSFNKAMDNISHQITILQLELAKNNPCQFHKGDLVIAKKDSGWSSNYSGEVWQVDYREYQEAWYIQLRNPQKWVKADDFEIIST